jgi:hypothetical protein
VAGGIEVATDQVVRAWRKAESTDLWLEYTPAKGAPSQHHAVGAALLAANEEFGEWDESGDFASAQGPWEEPLHGVASQILLDHCESEVALRRWLAAFARVMDEAGAAGTLKPERRRDHPSWDVVDTIRWPQLSAFIAYTMEGPPEEPARWNVAPESTARIAALDETNAFPGAESYIGTLRTRRAASAAVGASLKRVLPRDCIVSTTHLRPDPPRFVHSAFGGNGHTMRVVYDPTLSWQERLAESLGFMTALADVTTLAFVQYATGIMHGFNGLKTGKPPLPPGSNEYDFRETPERLVEYVPDARGAIVLTDAHLERANDLRGWSTTSLGAGRHLVQAAEPGDWFAQPEVDPEVLATARADFGEMIWHP